MNKYKKEDFAIKLSNVGKKYTIHHEKPTFIESIIKGKTEEFWALKNINLKIKKGERVGVIGPNGCGKTTLLKIIMGITAQTTGNVVTNGKIVSLIDINAGFHSDLTGIQNIFLNGMILGMKKSDIELKIKDIIKFADIGKFIDAPLFTYSSGMVLRLGFSIVIHSDPEILVLDENISVGDQDFRRKSYNILCNFLKQGRTMIVASHDLDFIKKQCSRVIWFRKGSLVEDGPTEKLLVKYKNFRNLHNSRTT